MAGKFKSKPAVAIIGVGLIGGSIGLALGRARAARSVTGVFRRSSQIAVARRMGAVGRGTTDPVRGVRGADIVFLSMSPARIVRSARQIMPHLKKGAILTDVGSTKADLVRRIERFKRRDVSFIGGHPLAGSEQSGVRAAGHDLFAGATWILTPSKDASARDVSRLKKLLLRICGRVRSMSPRAHDAALALTSHLPHAVATTLASRLNPRHLPFVAKGFKDMTRIASADPALWNEIFLTNHKALAGCLSDMRAELARLERFVRGRNQSALLDCLRRGKRWRDRISDESMQRK